MIAQEQISIAQAEGKAEMKLPKCIHMQKADLMAKFSRYLTLDGKTFNGSDHLTARFWTIDQENSEDYNLHRIKFDGLTVAYGADSDGNLSIALVLKSPADEYVKRIGRQMSSIALMCYNDQPNRYFDFWTMHAPLGYLSFATSVSIDELLADVELFPNTMLDKITADDLRNSYLMDVVEKKVEQFIRYGINNFSGNYSAMSVI